jgi:hypothetical protein
MRTLPEMMLTREIGRRIIENLKDVDDVGIEILVDALMSVSVAFVTAADLNEDRLGLEWMEAVKASKKRRREEG